MEPNLGSYLQNQIKQAQQIELQLEQTASQKYQLEIKVKELEKTLKELNEIPDGTDIYRNTGVVMYKVLEKKKLIDELEEQKELSEIRIKTYERQQKSLEDRYKELEESLRKSYEQQQKK